jgi:hypothetical protein
MSAYFELYVQHLKPFLHTYIHTYIRTTYASNDSQTHIILPTLCTVFCMSAYFELYGQHLECLCDLEASLKALYGTSDLFSLARANAEGCRFPDRVTRVLRRLCRLYVLHLNALIHHWLALDNEGLPKHQVPAHLEGVDVSWWTTTVPQGHARTLPLKLKVVYVLAKALNQDSRTANQDVTEIVGDEKIHGHLATYTWSSGLKSLVSASDRVGAKKTYGRCTKDPITLKTVPAVVNHRIMNMRGLPPKQSNVVAVLQQAATVAADEQVAEDHRAGTS